MASDKQRRQQRLFALKGTLTAASVNCMNAVKTPELSRLSKNDLTIASYHIDAALRRFNKEVGWPKED
jgi:hypothetical protein